jgi:hypothetical protein
MTFSSLARSTTALVLVRLLYHGIACDARFGSDVGVKTNLSIVLARFKRAIQYSAA